VGDEILRTIAQNMKNTLRDSDTLCRLGGDEFVALFPDLDHHANYTGALDRLLHSVSSSITVGHEKIQLSASIGAALFTETTESADLLLRNADKAMYDAKMSGKNRICFYKSS
jgi:diguanylate cyclase (GGDEF)-like protein